MSIFNAVQKEGSLKRSRPGPARGSMPPHLISGENHSVGNMHDDRLMNWLLFDRFKVRKIVLESNGNLPPKGIAAHGIVSDPTIDNYM